MCWLAGWLKHLLVCEAGASDSFGHCKERVGELVKVGMNWIIGFMILSAKALQRCKNAFVLRVTFC